jgi:hypothetical protein
MMIEDKGDMSIAISRSQTVEGAERAQNALKV